MTQYTHVNNGGENVFCVVGAVVISQVWSQFQTTVVTAEKSASLVWASMKLVNKLRVNNSTEEYRRSACEDFKCDYKVVCKLKHGEIISVIS
jgi:hypothetical protein